MFVKLSKSDIDKFLPQAYQMSLTPEMTSYPVYYDGIKTEEDFIERALKAFARDNEEIVLFYHNNEYCGWIHYYYLEEEKYLGTVSLSARKGTAQMLDEFSEYLKHKYPDAIIYLGFPDENCSALSHLEKRGFSVSELNTEIKERMKPPWSKKSQIKEALLTLSELGDNDAVTKIVVRIEIENDESSKAKPKS